MTRLALLIPLALAAATVVAASTISAQTPPAATVAAEPALSFEAASVKPNKSGEQEQFVRRQPGGRFDAKNMPLRALITFAYQIQGFQLVGAPGWTTTDRFDIVARAAGDPPPVMPGSGPDQLMLMMRTLLAERFKMVAHRETQELPIYALVLARRDEKLGPKLRPATTDCAAQAAAARGGGPPPAPTGPDAPVACGVRMRPGRIQFGGFPLSQFANGISGQVQRVVLDRTGLTGNWDFELTYTPDQSQPPPGGGPPPGVELPAVDPNGPSLFTAVQEQLGLKLEPARGPVDVLVIDRIEQPTPD
jgi:uncharacterized protein (TIGR03435 family)